MSIEAVNRKMVEEALRGKTVVRLKGGDATIFGRLAEEIAALRAAGIPLEIVPGVTAGSAAAACAGVPLTHGRQSSAVALVTGHERDDKQHPNLDYAALAAFPGTLIFYMGVTTAAQWSAALIREGKPPTTPAAVVRRCSWPDQEVIFCTLESIASTITAHRNSAASRGLGRGRGKAKYSVGTRIHGRYSPQPATWRPVRWPWFASSLCHSMFLCPFSGAEPAPPFPSPCSGLVGRLSIQVCLSSGRTQGHCQKTGKAIALEFAWPGCCNNRRPSRCPRF